VIAARFWAPLDVRIEDVPTPDCGPGDVLVRVEAALTCGTDAKCYRQGHPILLGPPPAPFGHEYAGVVAAVGAGAPFAVGERVCGANSAPCGDCAMCRAQREELCERLYPLLNGSYAELLLVPAHIARVNLHRIPPGVPPHVAAAVEPLACALHGAEDAGAAVGTTVGILGRGPIARLLAIACRARGAECELLGRDGSAARRFDAVVEAAGSAEAWRRSLDLVRPGGTVVLFGGLPREATVEIPAYRLHYEGLTLRGTFHHRPRDVRAALDLIAADPDAVERLLTHEFPLRDVVEPLRRSAGLEPRAGLVKAVIRP
jgi:L-iditol 2-dehydrogenase